MHHHCKTFRYLKETLWPDLAGSRAYGMFQKQCHDIWTIKQLKRREWIEQKFFSSDVPLSNRSLSRRKVYRTDQISQLNRTATNIWLWLPLSNRSTRLTPRTLGIRPTNARPVDNTVCILGPKSVGMTLTIPMPRVVLLGNEATARGKASVGLTAISQRYCFAHTQ
jgi:hypothetical protein